MSLCSLVGPQLTVAMRLVVRRPPPDVTESRTVRQFVLAFVCRRARSALGALESTDGDSVNGDEALLV